MSKVSLSVSETFITHHVYADRVPCLLCRSFTIHFCDGFFYAFDTSLEIRLYDREYK